MQSEIPDSWNPKRPTPIILSWSGGKDASFTLYKLLQSEKYEVKGLLTTIYGPNKRVSMHGVPEKLIEQQAKQIGLPLTKIYIQEKTHDEYEEKMRVILLDFKKEGINHMAFGDIFLEDLKVYRDNRLAEVDMKGIFPLWQEDTKNLAQQFIQKGFKTHVCSINKDLLNESHIGVNYDSTFLETLPENVDPCGENGEFHTFCYDGPIFKEKVMFKQNGIVNKEYSHNGETYTYLFSDITLG